MNDDDDDNIVDFESAKTFIKKLQEKVDEDSLITFMFEATKEIFSVSKNHFSELHEHKTELACDLARKQALVDTLRYQGEIHRKCFSLLDNLQKFDDRLVQDIFIFFYEKENNSGKLSTTEFNRRLVGLLHDHFEERRRMQLDFVESINDITI